VADTNETPPAQPPEDLLDALRRFARTTEIWTLIPVWESLPDGIPMVDCSKRHDH